jgi:uncharacterized protein YlxP (DUF503 family)
LKENQGGHFLFIAYGKAEVFLPYSHSLKDKRMLIKGLMERLKKRSSISVSEVSGQDLWQRSVIGFSLVSGKYSEADFYIQLIRDTFYRYSDQLEITAFDFEIDNVF